MRLFDTSVQLLKYRVLKAVAKRAFEDRLDTCYTEIPKEIVPGKEATMRCCVYKERAILAERVKLAMGGCNRTTMLSRSSTPPATSALWAATKSPTPAAVASLTAARMSAREALSPLTTIMSPILTNPSASAAECVPRSAPTPPLSAVNARVRTLARSKLSQ